MAKANIQVILVLYQQALKNPLNQQSSGFYKSVMQSAIQAWRVYFTDCTKEFIACEEYIYD
jgi:hypothetical protein